MKRLLVMPAAAEVPLRLTPGTARFTVLLGVLAALPALSIDISAPTLAMLPRELGTSSFTAGLTLSLFMAGFALGQLYGGLASDRRGRKPVLIGGLAWFSVAGLACVVARTGMLLVGARFVQGLGAGVCSVLAFAIVQDLFQGETARRMRSYVAMVFGAVPVCAPFAGTAIVSLLGWRSVYGVLVVAGCLISTVVWFGLSESKAVAERPLATRRQPVTSPLLRDRAFISLTVVNALGYACIFAYIAGSPVVVMGQLGRPASHFAFLFAATALALTAGAWSSARLGRRKLSPAALLDRGLCLSAGTSLVLAVVVGLRPVSAASAIPLLVAVLFARGIAAPNLQHLAMERVHGGAGFGSALIGLLQLLTGAAASAVVALLLPHLGAAGVAIPMAVLSVCALILWLWCRRSIIHA